MSLNKVGTNSIWSGVGFAFGKGGLLIAISLASGLVTLTEFAEFNIFLLSMNVFSGVIGGAMSLTANRYGSTSENVIALLFLALLSALLSCALYTSYEVLYNQSWASINQLIILSSIIFGTTYFTSLNGVYYARGYFKSYAILNFIYGVLIIGLSFLLGSQYDVSGVYLAFFIVPIFTIFISFIFLYKKEELVLRLNWSLIKRASKKVLIPTIISGSLFQPAVLISALLVDKFSSEQELIAYAVANQFRMVVNFIPLILGSVLMKFLVDDIGEKTDSVERVNFSLSYYPILILIISICLMSDVILLFFENVDTDIFKISLFVLLAASLITSFKSAIARQFVTREMGRISIWSNLSWLIVFLIASYITIPIYGALGAVFSFLGAHIIHLLGWSRYYYKNDYFHVPFFDRRFYGALILFVISMVMIYIQYWVIFGVGILALLAIIYSEYTKLNKETQS